MWSRKSSCVVLINSSVLARLSRNFFTDSSGVITVLVGSSGSGAFALKLRSCSIATSFSSLPAVTLRFSGVRGVFSTPSVTLPKINASDSAMWSAHSAIDQRSGADLKLYCACDKPFVASRNTFLDPSSSAIALSRSSWVSVVVAGAAAITIATANSKLLIMVSSHLPVGITHAVLNCIALFHTGVGRILGKGIFLVLPERPIGLKVVVINKGVKCVVHVPGVGALQVGNTDKFELNSLRRRVVHASHRRLIAGHAIVGELQLIPVDIVQGDHFHRLAIVLHMEFLEEGGSPGGQLHVQSGLATYVCLRLPVSNKSLQLLEGGRTAAARGSCVPRSEYGRCSDKQDHRDSFPHGIHVLPPSKKNLTAYSN